MKLCFIIILAFVVSSSSKDVSDWKNDDNINITDNSGIERTPSVTDGTSSDTEETPVTDGTTSVIDETTSVADGTSSEIDETTSVTDGTTSFTEGTTSFTEGMTSVTEETTSVTEGTTSVTEGTTSATEGTTSVTEETTSVTEGTISNTYNTSSCSGNDFSCTNGRCILLSWKCDQRDDCGDNSDEVDCAQVQNCTKIFMCGNGEWIAKLWRCDGERDCNDGSDEIDCDSTSCDPDTEMRCGSGQCIPTTWACDGTNDCIDAADEAKCSQRKVCRLYEYKCVDGSCINRTLVCNRKADCADGSDEKNCTYKPCNEGKFQCNDGTCIYDHERCDGHVDCKDREDEQNCPTATCEADQYHCSFNKRCISRRWVCDGDDDCGDGEDENFENCGTPLNCSEFSCRASAQCVPWTLVCDGKNDCIRGTDEGGLCSEACSGGRGTCSQMCQKTPQGSKCSCYKGYTMLSDNVTCVDVNECDVPGTCSQFCKNTEGGFNCFCADGYSMDRYGKCKAIGGSATLLYLLPEKIVGIDLQTQLMSINVSAEERVDLRGLDFDASQGVIFWSNRIEGTINSFNTRTNKTKLLHPARYNPHVLRWDWIHKNFYYTYDFRKVAVCTKNGEYCKTVVVNGASVIQGFDISPHKSLLFWSVWTTFAHREYGMIERADLDGSRRIAVINQGAVWPSAVTVDHLMFMIYWIDVRLGVMECSDFNGLRRRVVVSGVMYYSFAMTMFEDFVYWSDWGSDSIKRCDKHSGLNCTDVHKKQVKSEVLVILHEAQQPKGENRCFHNECSQLCVPTRSSFVCLCDDEYNMVNGSCVMKPEIRELHSRRYRFGP